MTGPALPGIIAKVLVIVEKVLDCFVVLEYDPAADLCCAAGNYSGSLTPICGVMLTDALSAMILQLASLGSYLFSALGVNVI